MQTYVGITTSQPHTDQKPMEMSKTQFAGLKLVPLHFWFSRSSCKVVGEAMECFCFLRNIQDKLPDRQSPHERRFEPPFDCPVIPFGPFFSKKSNLYERQKSCSSIWYNDASRNLHRVHAEFWRRLDQRLGHRGLARHREQRRVRSSRQEVQV